MPNYPRGLPRLQDLPPNAFFLDDSNTSLIKYTPPFTQLQNNTCAGGTCTSLGNATGALEFSFNGTDVWLFGKPGGLTRVFLDNQLVDVLDSSTLPNNGSALWAANGLNQGAHSVKLGGVDGNGLNLLIDFFSVNGVVSNPSNSTSTSTDTNYLPPEKLTPIIVGSLIGFFALVGVIGISILLCVRRKKRRRISKSGIKLVSFDGSAGTGGRRSISNVGLLSGLSGIFPRRSNTKRRSQSDMAGDGYEGRVSNSTDSGNPFLKSQSQYASTTTNTMTSTYSPPSSADASVPLFAQPQVRQLSFIPESTTSSSFSSMPSPPLQPPPKPPLEQQRQLQLQQLRTMNLTSTYPPKNGPSTLASSNDMLEPKWTSPTEAPPPSYHQPQLRPFQDPIVFQGTRETIKRADYKITNLPPRGKGDGADRSASRVPMASFSTTAISTAYTSTVLPDPQMSTRSAQVTMPDRPGGSPPPSFNTLEIHNRAGPVLPLPPKTDNDPQLSSGKTLKGPRPQGVSNAQPQSSTTMTLRPEDEEPESPVDPAVNFRSHWY